MDLKTYKESLSADAPPDTINIALQALWHAGNNDWHAAHDLLQGQNNQAADWVHAYLHREEGDIPNANYWYQRAGKSMPQQSLAEEWEAIALELLT